MDRRQALDEGGDKVGGCSTFAAVVAGVPHGDLVDLEVRNGFGLSSHEFLDLLNHEQGGSGLGVAASAGDESGITFCFGFEHSALPLCFGVVGSQGGVSLTLGDAALALGLGFGCDFDLLLRDFLTGNFLGSQALAFKLVLRLLDFNLGLALGDFRTLERLGFLLSEVGVEAGNVSTGQVFTFNGLGFLLLNEDTSVGFCFFLTLVRFGLVSSDFNFSLRSAWACPTAPWRVALARSTSALAMASAAALAPIDLM